jgi:hypothetical protein
VEVETIYGLRDASFAARAHGMCIGDRDDGDRSGSRGTASAAGNILCVRNRGNEIDSMGESPSLVLVVNDTKLLMLLYQV